MGEHPLENFPWQRGCAGTLVTIIFWPTAARHHERTRVRRRRSVPDNEFKERDTGDRILERVRHHAGPQALPQMRQDAEENSKEADRDHHSSSLVCMRQPENHPGCDDADDGVPTERPELTLQISAENDFFKQPRANAQQHKERGLKIGMRSDGPEKTDGLIG